MKSNASTRAHGSMRWCPSPHLPLALSFCSFTVLKEQTQQHRPLTDTMLITETHKDVPTQAGGDMSAYGSSIVILCSLLIIDPRDLHLPPNNRQLP